MYRRQIKRGKFFLHEHPATAMSWSEEPIDRLCKHHSTHLVAADQCAYGLLTPSEADRSVLAPALKPTKFLTNSEIMSRQLSRRCTKDHDHRPLVGGRCSAAAMYPVPLVKATLHGIAPQAKEGKLIKSQKFCAMPMSYNSHSMKSAHSFFSAKGQWRENAYHL